MSIPSPFALLQDFLQNPKPGALPPLDWAYTEARQRLVLLLNHVLLQENQATERLARHNGQVVLLRWRTLSLQLRASAAGLLELAPAETKPDLTLTLSQSSPLALAKDALCGDKPALQVEGDVQLASDVSWLIEHVRWDIEEDLARLLGDVPATMLCQGARQLAQALRQFVFKGASGTAHRANP